VSCFKPFKRTFRKESNNAKIKNRYLEPNKIKLATWVKTTLDKTFSPKISNLDSRLYEFDL
jgi:hypothetical protein